MAEASPDHGVSGTPVRRGDANERSHGCRRVHQGQSWIKKTQLQRCLRIVAAVVGVSFSLCGRPEDGASSARSGSGPRTFRFAAAQFARYVARVDQRTAVKADPSALRKHRHLANRLSHAETCHSSLDPASHILGVADSAETPDLPVTSPYGETDHDFLLRVVASSDHPPISPIEQPSPPRSLNAARQAVSSELTPFDADLGAVRERVACRCNVTLFRSGPPITSPSNANRSCKVGIMNHIALRLSLMSTAELAAVFRDPQATDWQQLPHGTAVSLMAGPFDGWIEGEYYVQLVNTAVVTVTLQQLQKLHSVLTDRTAHLSDYERWVALDEIANVQAELRQGNVRHLLALLATAAYLLRKGRLCVSTIVSSGQGSGVVPGPCPNNENTPMKQTRSRFWRPGGCHKAPRTFRHGRWRGIYLPANHAVVVFEPCGHSLACKSCAENRAIRGCPVCGEIFPRGKYAQMKLAARLATTSS